MLAGSYLAGVWLDGVGSTLPSRLLPRVPNYFLQVAALFPRAATMSIDYRAEAWVCADKRWEELDTRPYFPLDPEDKENRFQRVMHFFRQDGTTMHALDAYLVQSHATGKGLDGIDAVKADRRRSAAQSAHPATEPGRAARAQSSPAARRVSGGRATRLLSHASIQGRGAMRVPRREGIE